MWMQWSPHGHSAVWTCITCPQFVDHQCLSIGGCCVDRNIVFIRRGCSWTLVLCSSSVLEVEEARDIILPVSCWSVLFQHRIMLIIDHKRNKFSEVHRHSGSVQCFGGNHKHILKTLSSCKSICWSLNCTDHWPCMPYSSLWVFAW
jgi:hypothetical protein